MAISRADMRIYQGDDYRGVVTVTKGDTSPELVLVDCTVRAQIREGPADVASEALEIETAIFSPLIYLTIPRDKTVDLCGEYKWDLELTSPPGIVTTLLYGDVRVTPEVTR